MIGKIVFFQDGKEVAKGLINIQMGLEEGLNIVINRLQLKPSQWDSFQAFGKTVSKHDVKIK